MGHDVYGVLRSTNNRLKLAKLLYRRPFQLDCEKRAAHACWLHNARRLGYNQITNSALHNLARTELDMTTNQVVSLA